AEHEHPGIGRGHALQVFAQLLHETALADEEDVGLGRMFEPDVFAAQSLGREGAIHGDEELAHRYRLLDEIIRAEPGRLDRRFDGAVSRHHHDRYLGLPARGPFLEQRDAVRSGHPDIEQHQVRLLFAIKLACALRAVGGCHAVMLVLENLLDQPADLRFVIDDEDIAAAHVPLSPCARRRGSAATSAVGSAWRNALVTGSRIVTPAPPFGRFSAMILPLCSSMMRFTMARPRPVPFTLLVTYGSNSRSMRSAGKPGPLSQMLNSIWWRSFSRTCRVLMRIAGFG